MRHVFLPNEIIAHDAGQSLSRSEAIAFVLQHLDRYIDEAKRQAQTAPVGLNVIVVIDRSRAERQDFGGN